MRKKNIVAMEGEYISNLNGAIKVPDGHCWVEGDNSASSCDSRSFGPCWSKQRDDHADAGGFPFTGDEKKQAGVVTTVYVVNNNHPLVISGIPKTSGSKYGFQTLRLHLKSGLPNSLYPLKLSSPPSPTLSEGTSRVALWIFI